jgi:hypothetical protein
MKTSEKSRCTIFNGSSSKDRRGGGLTHIGPFDNEEDAEKEESLP